MSTGTSDAVASVHGVWSYKDLEPEQVRWYWNKTPLSLKGSANFGPSTANLSHTCIHLLSLSWKNEPRSGLCSDISAGHIPPSAHAAVLQQR